MGPKCTFTTYNLQLILQRHLAYHTPADFSGWRDRACVMRADYDDYFFQSRLTNSS